MLVIFQNQQDASGWSKSLPERSSSTRLVRLECKSECFALSSEHWDRQRTLKEGIMLATRGQSATMLRFTICMLRYLNKGMRVNHEISLECIGGPPDET